MTVSSTNNRESFAGNDVTTVFSFPNKFLKDADLVVILKTDATGVEVLQVITTNYTVLGAGADVGGSVTMLVAPPTGKSLIILRDPAIIQETDLRENDSLPAESVEDEFDRGILVSQRLDDQIQRSSKLPDGFTATFNTDLPGLLPADTVIAVNSAGNGFVEGPTITDIADAAANAAAAAASAAAAAISETNAATSETNAAASAATINIDVAVADKRGTLIIQNATDNGFSRLALGTAGQHLKSEGDDAVPTWETPATFLMAGLINNLSIAEAQTSVAADSIKITSADGTALSASNKGRIALPSVTNGRVTVFEITADITIDLTGAPWGSVRDLTDILLMVYALNNDGSLIIGISPDPDKSLVLNADDETVATNATSYEKVLVNSALTADAQAVRLGWFKSNFDFTGGSSEALHVVQTSDDSMGVGTTPESRDVLRLRTGAGEGSSSTKIRRFSVTVEHLGLAIAYADSSTLGAVFNIRKSGFYTVSSTDAEAVTAAVHGISLDSAELTTNIQSLTTDADRLSQQNSINDGSAGTTMWAGWLDAGAALRIHTDGNNSATSVLASVTIARGGPVRYV